MTETPDHFDPDEGALGMEDEPLTADDARALDRGGKADRQREQEVRLNGMAQAIEFQRARIAAGMDPSTSQVLAQAKAFADFLADGTTPTQ